jgi:DNA-binding GntR family transcriptional regulator
MLPWLDILTTEQDALAQVRDISLGKLVRDDVLRRIVTGELTVGVRINEPDVAQRLKVSRVPVREALRELESSGLVEVRKNAGVFVRNITEREVNELYDLRGLLDGYAGQQAAARVTTATLRALKDSLKNMRSHAKQQQVRDYYVENLRFHWLIIEAASNTQLEQIYRNVTQRLHLARLENLSRINGMSISIAEHKAIVQALESRDTLRSASLLSAHVHQARLRRQQHEEQA